MTNKGSIAVAIHVRRDSRPNMEKNVAAEEAHFVEMEKGNRKAKWYEKKI